MREDKPDYDASFAAFVEHLDSYESVGDPQLDAVRFVSTPLSAGQVSADLHAKMDAGDILIVAQVMEGTYCGWLDQKVWDWTEARVVGRSAPSPDAPKAEGEGPSES
jgi:hypothetical protein